jgi:tRNA-splicing ligase RtcB
VRAGSEEEQPMTQITVRGDVDERAVEQLKRCADAGDAPLAAMLPDGHVGYSQPIGGVIGYRDYLSPSGVGYDIGCGNKAVRTGIKYVELQDALPDVMDEIYRRISFGVGRVNDEPVDHPVFDDIAGSSLKEVRDLLPKARKQLGTVGSGNHYVDLFHEEETGEVWIGVHFGSRGFGHNIATGFLNLADGFTWDGLDVDTQKRRKIVGEMDAPPTLIEADSYLGEAYLESMTLAGDFAHAGRDMVVDKVLEILGGEAEYEVHNHHNYTWRETHGGESLWVVRKGCTPAFPGQEGFVGSTMGEASVVLEGKELNPEYGVSSAVSRVSQRRQQEALLYSTVHGAGRVMSRTQAAGKMGSRAECTARDCDYWVRWGAYLDARRERGLREDERLNLCSRHPDLKMQKRRGRVAEGEIDWHQTKKYLRENNNVELRGAGADEAPGAYKRLDQVLDHVSDTITIKHKLRPIGVAMAGADTHDPWKD